MKEDEITKLLTELLALSKENEWVEFKKDNWNPEEIGEYISALSNSACYHNQPFGYLVFGIEDTTHKIIGTSFRPKHEKKGNQELENWWATQLNPRIDFSINEFEVSGQNIVLFKIDSTKNTPVCFRGTPFIRIGSYKKPLDEHPERERKIWNKGHFVAWEKLPATDLVGPSEVLELIDYLGYFSMMALPVPDNRDGIFKRLIQDQLIIPEQNDYVITNLGAILFAKNIDTFEKLSRKSIRVVFYKGKNRISTIKEQTGSKGYAVGFQGLNKFILEQLPSNEIIKDSLRKTVSLYPEIAIRELIANAIIHQDFSMTGNSVMIEFFEDRIEITNPGKPIIDPLRFVDHSPQSRNELLARLMRRVNICEERGSGFDKVIFECEFYQLPAPEIIVGDNYTRVILFAPKSLRKMDRQDKIRACYLHGCLKYVSGELMTNQSLRVRFGIKEENYSIVSRIIAETKEAGLVKDYDPDNKSRTYAKYVPFWV